MTYANDCIAIRDRDKRRSLKRIERHTDEELDAAIEAARRRFGDEFWLLLHGIDAYMERRKRRDVRREDRRESMMDRLKHDIMIDDIWGTD